MNLITHRFNNRRTIFIIGVNLCGIFYNLNSFKQGTNVAKQKKFVNEGSEIVLHGGLSLYDWRMVLEDMGPLANTIKYSYSTHPLINYKTQSQKTQFSVTSIGGLKNENVNFRAVNPLHSKHVNQNLQKASTKNNDNINLSGTEFIYSDYGIGSMMASESVRDDLASLPEMEDMVYMKYTDNNTDITEQSNVYFNTTQSKNIKKEFWINSGMRVLQGFEFSDRRIDHGGDFVMSMPTFYEILASDQFYLPWDKIEMHKLMIFMKDGFEDDASQDKIIEHLTNIIKKLYEANRDIKIFVQKKFEKDFKTIDSIVTVVIGFLTVISLCLSFFSLVVTMSSNIVDQCKEIAVLRSLGVTKGIITKILVYESIVIVATGGFFGMVSGLTVGYTITNQNSFFNQTEPEIIMPFRFFGIIIVFGIVSSLLSAALPGRKMLKMQISQLLRGSYDG